MTSAYARMSARTLAMIRRKGAVVQFPGVTPRIHNPLTATWTGGLPTLDQGFAVQIEGDPDRFNSLSLVLKDPVTLLVAASGLSTVPKPGLPITWAGLTYTIKDVNPTAPDGVAIVYEITGSR